MEDYNDPSTDEILGITRCARCGHRLEGEVDCPFCAVMRGVDGPAPEDVPLGTRHSMSLWIYLTAMLMTFPLSLPWLLMSSRLSASQKAVSLIAGIMLSAAVIWFV